MTPSYNLHKGDCLDIMPSIPDKSIDMILCDLPYGTTACKWDVVIPFDGMWSELKRVIKDNGCIALFGSEPFSSYLRMSNIKEYKYDWIWEKNKGSNFMLQKKQPKKVMENIIVFNANYYYPQMEKLSEVSYKRMRRKRSDRTTPEGGLYYIKKTLDYSKKETGYPKNIIRFNIEQNNQYKKYAFHPTQKPVPLLEYLIKTYTLEKETVLDFTMGSGSTGVACINTNRNFIGIEKDEKYFDIAKNRIKESSDQGVLYYS